MIVTQIQKTKTQILAVKGPGMFLDLERPPEEGGVMPAGLRLETVRDGSSQTAALVVAAPNRAVPWTKPADFTPDPTDPTAGLARDHEGKITLVTLDATIRRIRPDELTTEQWNNLFGIADGEKVNLP